MDKSKIRKNLANSVPFVVLVAALFCLTAAHAATIYIWRDADGTRQYSDYCPSGEKCRVKQIGSSDGTGGSGKRGKRWKDATTTDTGTTDTSTSADSGTTSDGATGDTTNAGETTTTTGDSTTEPTTEPTDSTSTTAGDTTTDTPTDDTAVDNTAVLEWDPVNDPDLAGYRVYHAVAGGTYPAFGSGINAGSSNTITISRLDSGTRYYFRVTAVDKTGNESGFSNEVYKDIP